MTIESPNYNSRCVACGEHSFSCHQYEIGYDIGYREIGTEPDMFFSRTYKCFYCRTEMSLYTIVDTLDTYELLRKDAEWLESLNNT